MISAWLLKLYSERKADAAKAEPDVYQYADVPENVRWRTYHATTDVVSQHAHSALGSQWHHVCEVAHRILVRRYGRGRLGEGTGRLNDVEDFVEFLFQTDTDRFLDALEAFWQSLPEKEHDSGRPAPYRELWEFLVNRIFEEEALGYQLHEGAVRRVDSQYLHREAVKPALGLLHARGFGSAVSEFEQAHEAYRHGKHDAAILEAENAFESCMKCALQELEQPLPAKATAAALIEACRTAGLLPPYLSQFTGGLGELLRGGLPNIRNQPAVGHGAGLNPDEIERSYAQLALHLCASYIVFISERLKELKP